MRPYLDEFRTALVELARLPEQVRHLPSLLEAVNRARGLPLSFLVVVRNRWAASVLPGVRAHALAVAEQLPELDFAFVEKMLNDPSVEVRVAACGAIDGIEGYEAQRAALVERRLKVE